MIREGNQDAIVCEFAFLRVIESRANQPGLELWLIILRLLLASVLPTPLFDIQAALERVRYYQKRNFVAFRSHCKTKLAQSH